MDLATRIMRRLSGILTSLMRDAKQCFLFVVNSLTGRKGGVVYIVEEADWSIRRDGMNTFAHIDETCGDKMLDTSSTFHRHKILHYGSSYVFEMNFKKSRIQKNKHIVTFFHGKYGEDSVVDRRFDLLLDNISFLSRVIYSNKTMKCRFLDLGIPESKLAHVPVGVDLVQFQPVDSRTKTRIRELLGVPEGSFVIGSFQKDGVGWGDGKLPKWEKGPDKFVEVVTELAKEAPVYCLLSGPARGYVRDELEAAGVQYHHKYFEEPNEVVQFYQALDAYLITSREEGGPKAIVESMACGIPVVSTRVGMAPEVLEDTGVGLVCEIDDVDALVSGLSHLWSSKELRNEYRLAGIKKAREFGWERIAAACQKIYKEVESIDAP